MNKSILCIAIGLSLVGCNDDSRDTLAPEKPPAVVEPIDPINPDNGDGWVDGSDKENNNGDIAPGSKPTTPDSGWTPGTPTTPGDEESAPLPGGGSPDVEVPDYPSVELPIWPGEPDFIGDKDFGLEVPTDPDFEFTPKPEDGTKPEDNTDGWVPGEKPTTPDEEVGTTPSQPDLGVDFKPEANFNKDDGQLYVKGESIGHVGKGEPGTIRLRAKDGKMYEFKEVTNSDGSKSYYNGGYKVTVDENGKVDWNYVGDLDLDMPSLVEPGTKPTEPDNGNGWVPDAPTTTPDNDVEVGIERPDNGTKPITPPDTNPDWEVGEEGNWNGDSDYEIMPPIENPLPPFLDIGVDFNPEIYLEQGQLYYKKTSIAHVGLSHKNEVTLRLRGGEKLVFRIVELGNGETAYYNGGFMISVEDDGLLNWVYVGDAELDGDFNITPPTVNPIPPFLDIGTDFKPDLRVEAGRVFYKKTSIATFGNGLRGEVNVHTVNNHHFTFKVIENEDGTKSYYNGGYIVTVENDYLNWVYVGDIDLDSDFEFTPKPEDGTDVINPDNGNGWMPGTKPEDNTGDVKPGTKPINPDNGNGWKPGTKPEDNTGDVESGIKPIDPDNGNGWKPGTKPEDNTGDVAPGEDMTNPDNGNGWKPGTKPEDNTGDVAPGEDMTNPDNGNGWIPGKPNGGEPDLPWAPGTKPIEPDNGNGWVPGKPNGGDPDIPWAPGLTPDDSTNGDGWVPGTDKEDDSIFIGDKDFGLVEPIDPDFEFTPKPEDGTDMTDPDNGNGWRPSKPGQGEPDIPYEPGIKPIEPDNGDGWVDGSDKEDNSVEVAPGIPGEDMTDPNNPDHAVPGRPSTPDGETPINPPSKPSDEIINPDNGDGWKPGTKPEDNTGDVESGIKPIDPDSGNGWKPGTKPEDNTGDVESGIKPIDPDNGDGWKPGTKPEDNTGDVESGINPIEPDNGNGWVPGEEVDNKEDEVTVPKPGTPGEEVDKPLDPDSGVVPGEKPVDREDNEVGIEAPNLWLEAEAGLGLPDRSIHKVCEDKYGSNIIDVSCQYDDGVNALEIDIGFYMGNSHNPSGYNYGWASFKISSESINNGEMLSPKFIAFVEDGSQTSTFENIDTTVFWNNDTSTLFAETRRAARVGGHIMMVSNNFVDEYTKVPHAWTPMNLLEISKEPNQAILNTKYSIGFDAKTKGFQKGKFGDAKLFSNMHELFKEAYPSQS
ncbi:hypothetical protein VCR15J2_390056 [Vibrio coralliirubri]|uniref:hypothetical protein n=1 Tax=Vibrio coralliirubri TaxID=1516159 RepID=UPI00063847EC|nr:hypothetical protein [Vibrio coralliirubri]CDT53306.1 hypothetical protein VCR15J2_390056 [Vibrio coralliirubri]